MLIFCDVVKWSLVGSVEMSHENVAFTGSVRLLYGSYANLQIAFWQNRSASHQCNDELH